MVNREPKEMTISCFLPANNFVLVTKWMLGPQNILTDTVLCQLATSYLESIHHKHNSYHINNFKLKELFHSFQIDVHQLIARTSSGDQSNEIASQRVNNDLSGLGR